MRRLFALCFWTVLLIGSIEACGDDAPGASQHARWDDAKPKTFVVQICTRGLYPPGCARAAIEAGEVVRAEEKVYDMGLDWEREDAPQDPIEYMFDQVRDPKNGCELSDVSYDKSLSFVRSYTLNCAGENSGGYVACFVPDTIDLKECDALPAM